MDKIKLPLINDQNKNSISCGHCTACCTVFEIEELGKKDRTNCIHLLGKEHHKIQGKGEGCRIYSERPKTCREFNCLWLLGKVRKGDTKYRPDRLGLILTIMEDAPLMDMLGVFRVIPGKLNSVAKELLERLEGNGLFFFEEKVYGPQKLIDEWKVRWGIREK